jgi:TM2 domain-containing membrane protein YozV
MRPIVYIVGAVAGFATFAGIGLIYRGFQLEGGIILAIGLLNLIVFVRYMVTEAKR